VATLVCTETTVVLVDLALNTRLRREPARLKIPEPFVGKMPPLSSCQVASWAAVGAAIALAP